MRGEIEGVGEGPVRAERTHSGGAIDLDSATLEERGGEGRHIRQRGGGRESRREME